MMERDGKHLSPWQRDIEAEIQTENTKSDKTYDCIIVGAGITGLTTALFLQKEGKSTLVLDSANPGFGTTGGTSAHINTFADTTYKEAESAFGAEGAKLFAEAINEGFGIIRENISNYQIACDFEEKDGFVYAEDEEQAKMLDDVYEGTRDVGVHIYYSKEIPVPVPFQRAVILKGQAQFHPIKYLKGLIEAYQNAGGELISGVLVNNISKIEGRLEVKSDPKTFFASKVVYATHIPPGVNVFSFRCAPYRSYVLGVKLKDDNYPDALVYDMQEPYHYFRTHVIEGQKVLLVGGEDHKTGHDDPEKAFSNLEKYVSRYYTIAKTEYKWSSQYYVPVDGLPYVGQIPFYEDGIYCATGYNGNGMMLGSISGRILADLVSGRKDAYADLFDSGRMKPIDGFREFVKENADAAYHFITDRFSVQETDSLKRLRPGKGKVLKFDGQKVAAYRDEAGEIHALSPVCTHAACIVAFNPEELSWDCPCHGARYDIDGKVITGPAEKPLQKINFEE